MARLARAIAPGMPHHITQRGNRRQQTFFGEEDYQHYLELMSRFCRAEQVAIWTHCLMPNHVHLIVVPQSAERACIAPSARHIAGTRGGLVQAPSRYRCSSAAAHLKGRDDALVQVAPLLQMAPNWRRLFTSAIREEELKALRAHERTGRPLGDENFLALLEQNLGRILRRQKPGLKDV